MIWGQTEKSEFAEKIKCCLYFKESASQPLTQQGHTESE